MTGSVMCPARTSARAVIVPESAPKDSRHGYRNLANGASQSVVWAPLIAADADIHPKGDDA
jgi:hypothetical protein